MQNRDVSLTDGLTRRDFVRLLGLGGATAFAAACASAASQEGGGATTAAGPTPLGIQLYTLRSIINQDTQGVLAELGRIGYREVETAGTAGKSAAEFRAMLDAAGLTAPSGHHAIERMRSDMPGVIAEARTLGHRFITVPFLMPNQRTLEGYRQLAADMNRFGEAARAAGMRLAYHNHDFEFQPVGGTTGWDVIMSETRPELVDIELDLYWAVRANQQPQALFAKHPGRVTMVHVKDMAAGGAMADVGAGTIDFRAIFAANPGIRHFFVERDDTKDPLATARASFASLRGTKP